MTLFFFFLLFLKHFDFLRDKNTYILPQRILLSFFKMKNKEDFATLTLNWKSIVGRAEHEKGPVEIITHATRVSSIV